MVPVLPQWVAPLVLSLHLLIPILGLILIGLRNQSRSLQRERQLLLKTYNLVHRCGRKGRGK